MSHIAFVSTMEQAPWGGSEELWAQAAQRLAARGCRVSANIVGWAPTPQPVAQLERAGARIARRPRVRGVMGLAWRRFFGPPEYRWLDLIRPELVVISQGNNLEGVGWMQACAQRGLRYVTIVQNAGPSIWPADAAAEAAACVYSGAIRNFFVSNANLRLTETQLACELSNAQIVKNPFLVPYDVVVPWPAEDGGTKLACVARLEPGSKGQDVLIEVLCQDKWRSRALNVTFFGSGDAAKTLARLTRMHGLESVRFGGFATSVTSIWATHHALVLPSRHEGLPLSLVEAMLCGRPAIVTDVAGNQELLEDNVTGFVAAAPTPGLLDEALERAWARRADWPLIGVAAARSIRQAVPPDPARDFAEDLLKLVVEADVS